MYLKLSAFKLVLDYNLEAVNKQIGIPSHPRYNFSYYITSINLIACLGLI